MIMVLFVAVSSFAATVQPSYAATAEARDPLGLGRIGYMISPYNDGKSQLWLGAQAITDQDSDAPAFCTQMTIDAPTSSSQIVAVDTLSQPLVKAPAGLALTTPQMAYLLGKYQYSSDPKVLAALSYLVHANYENGDPRGSGKSPWIPGTSLEANINWMVETVKHHGSFIDDQARSFVAEAVNSGAITYSIEGVSGDGRREGSLDGLQVKNSAGKAITGSALKVKLHGPAVFDETGTDTWEGTSQAEPITLAWHSTGNGEVTSTVTYTSTRKTLRLLNSGADKQKTLTYGSDQISSDLESAPGPSWKVIFDFQPIGVSHVQKLSDSGRFTDVFDASADPNYGSGEWISLDEAEAQKYSLKAGYVPITYIATAYYLGETPRARSADVPQDAHKIGSRNVVARGPGEIEASFTTQNPGFVSIVWEVVKQNQGSAAQLVHSDWKDDFAIPQETTSRRHTAEIATAISIRDTHAGTYLVDDVFVTGFASDHPNFAGDSRFVADTKVLEQELWFFPEGVQASEENMDAAERIGATVEIPARNGFYPSVGATSYKVKQDADGTPIPGTYVFVTSFAGDDRVAPLRTSFEDVTEQFTITHEPQLRTTLADATSGDEDVVKVHTEPVPAEGTRTLIDTVCYTNLKPGTQYELRGVLMDKHSEKPVVTPEGQDVRAEKSFIPDTANGCIEVAFDVDASMFAGTTTVAFETLYEDGKEIAVHADIDDENQTLVFEDKPDEPEEPKKEEADTPATLARTGSALGGAVVMASVLAGAGYLLVRKRI